MRLSLKAKLTALVSFLVWVVVLATSTVHLSSLTRQALREVEGKGQFVAQEIYHQARTALAHSRPPEGADLNDPEQLRRFAETTLATDPGLRSLVESVIAYSPTIYHVALTDPQNRVIVHNDPDETGRRFLRVPPYGQLTESGLVPQLRTIYGEPRVYEVVLPLEMGGAPLADVRVGVSTLFLRNQITPELRSAALLSALAIVLSTLSAGVLAYGLLRPLEAISRSVEQMTRGEYTGPVRLNRRDEWGILSSRLSLLGEQIRGEKAAFVALKENLDQLLSNLTDGMMLFDQYSRLVLATPAARRFLGRPAEGLGHGTALEVFTPNRPLDRLLRQAFSERRSFGWQLVETGDPVTPRVSASVQFIEDEGRPMGALVTLRDASTRAELEDQLDVTAKLAALGRITAGVAHEVKNPLNAMVLQLELLKTKLEDQGERVKPQIEILSAEIHRLDRVVRTFLDFTKPLELNPHETDLTALIKEVFTLVEPEAKQNSVRLVFETNGVLPALRLDRDLFKQALLNLVLNGCQAMPSGGELRVTPRIFGYHVEIEIADQGCGIPPEARKRIFSLFYSTKPGGSGVGLAMAYRIVQLHNGTIDFTSRPNEGTTFRISLPRQRVPSAA